MKHKILILLAAFFIMASSAHGFEVDGINYDPTGDGTVAVSGCYLSGDITIPETVTYGDNTFTVTSVGSNAFYYKTDLTSISIPSSVTSIGESAFYHCSGLTSISIPSSVTSIGKSAFEDCWNLSKVFISDLSAWCKIAFADRDSNPLYNAHNLYLNGAIVEKLIIPDGVKSIGDYAFCGCYDIPSVSIPESVTSIGKWTFADCYNLSEVHISDLSAWCKIAFEDSSSNPLTFAKKLYLNGALVEKLIIPEGVTAIGDYAFSGCFCLSSVIFPDGLTSIGKDAFNDCTGLTSINIPNSVTSIGGSTFSNCTSLTSINIPNSVTSISGYAFSGCSSLTSINLPDGITSIEDGVFRDCSGLTSINIPKSVTSIWRESFRRCTGLTSINIPEGVTLIRSYAFDGCTGLTSITIPSTVTNIEYNAFSASTKSGCSITFNCKACEIDPTAFNNRNFDTVNTNKDFLENCKLTDSYGQPIFTTSNINVDGAPLKSLVIPDTSESFQNLAFFNNCQSIQSIHTGNGLKQFPADVCDFSYITSVTLGTSMTSLGGAQFPNAVAVFANAATPPTITTSTFPSCEFGRSGIVIVDSSNTQKAYSKASVWQDMQISNPENVAEVTVEEAGDLSFEMIVQTGIAVAKVVKLKVNGPVNDADFQQMRTNMIALMDIDLSDAEIATIPAGALSGKVTLSSIKLPETCTAIGANAFANCSNLKSVEFGDDIASIGSEAFSHCSSLSEVTLPWSLKEIGGYAFEGSGVGNVEFNMGLESIGNNAFQGCDLGEVSLPYSLQTIGNYAFYNAKISSLELGDNLTTIGDYAFYGCGLAQELELPSSLTYIGERAFAGQPGLKGQVTIGDNVTYMGSGAFQGTSIATVFLSNKLDGINAEVFKGCENLNTVYVPDNITYFGNSAFEGCLKLSQLRLPEFLEELGASSLKSTKVRNVLVPERVTAINESTFANCLSLRSLSLPSGVSMIDSKAFYGCKAMRNLSINSIDPPTIADATVFRGVNTDLCILSIPSASYRDYVLADYWGQFIQMRNDIAVEEEGNGVTTFDSESNLDDEGDDNGDENPGDNGDENGENPGDENDENPGDGITIYWDNSVAGWTTPHVHYWGASQSKWPGVAMTEVTKEVWKYTLPAGTTGVVFNAGDGDATKTKDFIVVDNHIYNQTGDQGEYNGTTPTPNPGDNGDENGDNPGDELTIYWDNSVAGWATPHVHYWGTIQSTWPGVAMTQVTEEIWKYTLPAGTTGVVFNAGDGDVTKTKDFAVVPNHIYNQTGDQGEYNVDEPSDDQSEAAKAKAFRKRLAIRRAEAVNTAENGTTLYIPKNGMVRFFFTPAEGQRVIAVLLNGEDVTDQLVDNTLAVTADRRNGKLKVIYSAESLGVGATNVAPEADGEAVYYNLQGVRVENPENGIFIKKQGSKAEKVVF